MEDVDGDVKEVVWRREEGAQRDPLRMRWIWMRESVPRRCVAVKSCEANSRSHVPLHGLAMVLGEGKEKQKCVEVGFIGV